jgi:hypothetical protein
MRKREYLRHIRDLIVQYGDERSCVTFNSWYRTKSPEELLTEIEQDLARLTPKFDPQRGDIVKINGCGDLMMDRSMGKHIGEKVTVIKRCKSGLYQVHTTDGPKSFAKYNLDPTLE